MDGLWNGSEIRLVLGCGWEGGRDLWPDDILPIHVCHHRVFFAVLAVLGNSAALSAIFTNQKLRRKLTSIIILNLAVADLLVGLFVMPFGVMQLLTEDRWVFGPFFCRLWVALDVICCTASIVTLCVISIDRFLGVYHPLRYSTIVTRKRLYTAALTVWAFSVATLLLTVRYDLERRSSDLECHVGTELRFVTQSVILSFYIPLVIILIAYFKIYQVTKKREQSLFLGVTTGIKQQPQPIPLTRARGRTPLSVRPSPAPGGSLPSRPSALSRLSGRLAASFRPNRRSGSGSCSDSRLSASGLGAPQGLRMHIGGGAAGESRLEKQRRVYKYHKKSAKTLGLVVGLFLFCWLPFFIINPIAAASDKVPNILMEILTWLGYSNSSLNPVIYALTVRNFRETFGRQCYNLCRCLLGRRLSTRALGCLSLAPPDDDSNRRGEDSRSPSDCGANTPRLGTFKARASRKVSREGTRTPGMRRHSAGAGIEDVLIAPSTDDDLSILSSAPTPALHVRVRQVEAIENGPVPASREHDRYNFRVDLGAYLHLFPSKCSDV